MLSGITTFQNQHPAIVALTAFYVFSAIVSGMPEPSATSSMGYVWAYNSLHILSGNLNRLLASKLPPGTTTITSTTTATTTPPEKMPSADKE